MSQPKPFDIDRQLFAEAFEKVRDDEGAAGVDGVTAAAFAQRLDDNLFTLWNKMSSGTYHPSPVLAVDAQTGGGGSRGLAVPTVADRVAQTVVLLELEPRVEPIVHPEEYKPGRPLRGAIPVECERCWEKAWIVDMDTESFVDSIPWDTLLPVVAGHLDFRLRWVLLYLRLWLDAPVQWHGELLDSRGAGRTRGATSFSPLLASIYLRCVFDEWMARTFPVVQFERCSANAVVHCVSEPEARWVLAAARERLAAYGLDLTEARTRVAHCSSGRRPRSPGNTRAASCRTSVRPCG